MGRVEVEVVFKKFNLKFRPTTHVHIIFRRAHNRFGFTPRGDFLGLGLDCPPDRSGEGGRSGGAAAVSDMYDTLSTPDRPPLAAITGLKFLRL